MKFFINSPSWCLLALSLFCTPVLSQRYQDADGRLRVALVKMPYTGARNVAELSQNPDYLEQGGIARELAEMGVSVKPEIETVRLTDAPHPLRQTGFPQ